MIKKKNLNIWEVMNKIKKFQFNKKIKISK